MNTLGEPISGGQGRRAQDDLVYQSDDAIDLGKINALLQQARERSGQSQETVTTLNLVAIYFTQAQYESARAALEVAGSVHPCRLVVLIADESIAQGAVTARVSVVRSAGAITLERVVLNATGHAVRHLESAMDGLLLPELPMVVVWGGRPHGDLLQGAVEKADRIIIDSGARPPTYLAETASLLAAGAPIGDLAWARIFPWQGIAAEVLDLPNLREHRGNIRTARVVCAQAPGAEGALLAGWLAARVPKIKIELVAEGQAEAPGAPPAAAGAADKPLPSEAMTLGQIAHFEFSAPPATFRFRREKSILVAEVQGDDDGEVVHRVRLPPDQPGRLLGLELKLLSGIDDLYAQAVQAGVKLLGTAK
jgi:glucose-6-phosphate dehydrogenase assembly protein OpcA